MIERAIVMPRDITSNHSGIISIKSLLMENPNKEKKEERLKAMKMKGKKKKDRNQENL